MTIWLSSTFVNFVEKHWGDLASVIGFAFTIYTLLRTKQAAEAAKQAAFEIRERLIRELTVADFATVLATIEETKRLHRLQAWELSLDRYSLLRRLLVSIQESSPALKEEHRSVIAGVIQQFRTMEETIERARHKKTQADLDPVRLNNIAGRALDDLNGIMISIRQAGS